MLAMTRRPKVNELLDLVRNRTNGGVRNLSVECRPGRVVLRGQAHSYYVKQLAQHDLVSSLPEDLRLENAITVAR